MCGRAICDSRVALELPQIRNRIVQRISRRSFLKQAPLPLAAFYLGSRFSAPQARADLPEPITDSSAPGIVDTNVHLFDWPFRHLKYRDTGRLLQKLRGHRIEQAWAGSFEALLHKDLDAVNARLAEECAAKGQGMLLPFGTVNPAWPDWEEDLRRCRETYGMTGIRLYPSYHGYTLAHPEFRRLAALATEHGLIVQIALELEDSRVHHPIIHAPDANAALLPEILKEIPGARIQLLNAFSAIRPKGTSQALRDANVAVDIASIEGVGALGKLIDSSLAAERTTWPHEQFLFGSNAPFAPVENALLKLFESPLTEKQARAIMQTNARRLLAKPARGL